MAMVCAIFLCNVANAELLSENENSTSFVAGSNGQSNNYVATANSAQQFFYVLGGVMNKPFIVSDLAAKKKITGNFDMRDPQKILNEVTSRTALISYFDGSSYYIYASNEIQSRIVSLPNAPYDRLVEYLKSTGLYDSRFPPRSNGGAGSFYISGVPVYVELVSAAAKHINNNFARPDVGKSEIKVLKLKNTFVNDRTFTQRDTPVTIPGVATVLNQLLNGAGGENQGRTTPRANISVDNDTQNALAAAMASQTGNFPPLPAFNSRQASVDQDSPADDSKSSIRIVGYSDTNSLLLQGSARQVSFVEDLVHAIDVPKQQIQLYLWILDVSRDDVDELGVQWQGAAALGNTGVTFNTSSLTPQNSVRFLASVSALARKGDAQVVSRPEILTQENVPALFDNNSSFYARVVGERTASLEKITYGTMISVLPRIAHRSREIEMLLNIQDGGLPLNANGNVAEVDSLPVVSNTQINTAARVPIGSSLLIGGYSRDQHERHQVGIPLLKEIPILGRAFDYSYTSHKKMVRLFLIQPKLLKTGDSWQGGGYPQDDVLGHTTEGRDVTLKNTVATLQQYMKQ